MATILSYKNWKKNKKKNWKNSIRLAISKLLNKCEKIVECIKISFNFIIIKFPFIKKLPSKIYYVIIKMIRFIRNKSIYIGGIICVFGIYTLCRRFFPLIEARIIKSFPETTNKVFRAIAESELEIADKKKLAAKLAKDATISYTDRVRSRYLWIIKNVGPHYLSFMIAIILRRRSS